VRSSDRKEVKAMIKATVRYARYALTALAGVGFGLSVN
jgi:hypothetical protein